MLRAALVIVLLAAVGPAAHAGDGPEAARAVATARRHWRELDFELVLGAADRALAAPRVTPRDRVAALWLRGAALVVLDRPEQAGAAFRALFDVDSEYVAPAGTSPRILSVFEPARAAWQVERDQQLATRYGEALAALRTDVALPAGARGGQPLDVAIHIRDPHRVASKVVIAYRRRGAGEYSVITAAVRPGRTVVTIPGAVLAADDGYPLELYARVRHRSGGTLRRHGDAGRPLVVPVRAGQVPVAPPLTRRWWFWAGLAGLAVAGTLLVDQAIPAGPQQLEIR